MDGFRFTVPCRVRVADVNYGGHVSDAAILSYFQDARIAYLRRLGSFAELEIGGCGLILPEAHVYYRAELFLEDELIIGVRVGELRRSALVMDYRIERVGTLAAEGTTRLVAFDYRMRRPVRLPDAFQTAVLAFEGARLGSNR